jgi:hypothetical protein
MVHKIMNDDGLSDADMVHGADTIRLAQLFNADSVLYVTIKRWDAKYIVLNTSVTVEIGYVLKSGKTGETLWDDNQKFVYSSNDGNNSGGGLANLIVQAISAAVTKAKPNYLPLTRRANNNAIYRPYYGIPAGPYDPLYQKDQEQY